MAGRFDEPELICADFDAALARLQGEGARLEVIWPADAPHSAILTHQGKRLRLTAQPDAPPPSAAPPAFAPAFILTRAGGEAGAGRAGMAYRDLLPGRLGGHSIASHILIPAGGPVADWVHYHRVAFQLIVVRRGWVRVVYQDQGPPFLMHPGDMVLQPPGIRHRVLEASPGLEVVELGCPAVHETFADHALELPNGPARRGLTYGGQHFLHHVAATAPWTAWHGGEAQPTALHDATNGRADARLLRPGAAAAIAVPPHDGALVFGFVMEGSARLDLSGQAHALAPADAFAIPPDQPWRLAAMSAGFRLLHVTTRA